MRFFKNNFAHTLNRQGELGNFLFVFQFLLLLLFYHSIQVKDAEALGFATIFRKALLYHPPSKNLPPNIVSHMLQHMFNLTAHFCEASVRVENVNII